MKKLILAFALLIAFNTNAQDLNENKTHDNEVKLNLGYLLAGFPEFSYERILNDESSIGVSLGFPIDDVDVNYIVTPYYRLFFGKKRAAGFFIEGNAALFSEDYNYSTETGFGLGIGIGGKLLTKSNWTGELILGLGRTVINSGNAAEAYPRLGISIGKRF